MTASGLCTLPEEEEEEEAHQAKALRKMTVCRMLFCLSVHLSSNR